MNFSVARPDVVRAINQRWLLKFWQRHQGTHRVPLWQTVETEDLSRLTSNLSFLDVVDRGGSVRFQVRFHGAAVAQIYGAADCRGKYVDEIIPVANHSTGLAPYYQARECGHPVYTIHDITDRAGRLIHFERLLLPFASDGENIDRILTSLELICLDGAFDGHDLLKLSTVPSALRLSATIEPRAV